VSVTLSSVIAVDCCSVGTCRMRGVLEIALVNVVIHLNLAMVALLLIVPISVLELRSATLVVW
jgi:hypothetical protein